MKRFLCLLMVVCVLFGLSGCLKDAPYITESTTPSNTQPTQTESTTSPAATTQATFPQQQYPHPMAAVSMPVITNTRQANDGTPIFTYSFQTMSLVIQDPMASSITVDFLNETDFSGSAAEAIDLAAQTAYTGQEDWSAYFYSTLYTPTRLDQSILSLYGMKAYYDGAPHSGAVAHGLTYDLTHGTQLTLNQLLVPNFDSAVLSQLITAHFPADQTKSFYPDYADVIMDMFSGNIPVEDWYLTDKGLCFFFNPGEIAPYSEQIPESRIPYEELTGLLQEAYFPAETVEFHGAPKLEILDAGQLPVFDHIAEVILSEAGESYCLRTDGTIQNVRILTGSWDKTGEFTPAATVFAAQALTDGMAAVLQCTAEWIPLLCITYESGGEVYSVSAEDLLR